MLRFASLLSAFVLIASLTACSSPCCDESCGPRQGAWLGETPPAEGEVALFARGFVSGGFATRDLVMSPAGDEIVFGAYLGRYAVSTMLSTRLVDGAWTEPEVLPFAADPRHMTIEPAFSPDGKRLYFLSNRPRPGKDEDDRNQDIWFAERGPEGWGEAQHLGAPVNSEDPEFFPSLTEGGTLYFTRNAGGRRQPSAIYRARPEAGGFAEPERLPDTVNVPQGVFNAFIAPDESYILLSVAGRPDSLGGGDYYVSFRSDDDRWSVLQPLPAPVNSDGPQEWSPWVSADEEYLFFMSDRHDPWPERIDRAWLETMHNRPGHGQPSIYWTRAAFLEELRAQAEFPE